MGRIVERLLLITGILFCFSCSSLPESDHCDGIKFFNSAPGHSFTDEIRWFWEMETVEWPEQVIDEQQPKPPLRVKSGELRVTYINHATVLIQMDGINILTDPIFSDRAGPVSFIGSKRIRKPGVAIDDLPRIDIILISHNHYDHLDLPSLAAIGKRDKPVILAGLGVGKILDESLFTGIFELDWWQEYGFSSAEVKFVFVPAFHNSGRRLFDSDRTLWGGFVIEDKYGCIYFAGDTAYGGFLEAIHKRYPEFRLTIFPVGNYEKRWIMKTQHMNPDDAVRAHILLNSKQSIGMHYATFLEHPEQTIDQHKEDLGKALEEYNVQREKFLILKFGEGIYVP